MRTDQVAAAQAPNPGFWQPPGTWAAQLRRLCEGAAEPNPRLMFEPQWTQLKAATAIAAENLYQRRVAAREPIEVGVSHCPGCPRDSRVARTLMLYHDDFAEVVSRYSGVMVNGRWELLEFEPRYRPAGHA